MELMVRSEKPDGADGASAAAALAIRSSEDGGSASPLPQLAIQTVQILSHRVRQPVPSTYADPRYEGGLVRRLKRQRREGRPFVVYVLQVRWVEDPASK